MASGLPAHVEEADLISYGLDRPDLRDRALRPRARDQVRDLRDHPHPRRDHRRAALAGLGAALGARPRAGDRAGQRRSSSTSSSARPPTRRWPTELEHHHRRVPGGADADLQLDDRRARRAVDGVGLRAATRSRCSTRCRTRTRPTRPRSSTPSELKDRIADAIAAPARAREARDRPLLLREPDPARDRRGARRDRVAHLPAAHQGRAAAALAAGRRRTRAAADEPPR